MHSALYQDNCAGRIEDRLVQDSRRTLFDYQNVPATEGMEKITGDAVMRITIDWLNDEGLVLATEHRKGLSLGDSITFIPALPEIQVTCEPCGSLTPLGKTIVIGASKELTEDFRKSIKSLRVTIGCE